jgi:beta-glucosidase
MTALTLVSEELTRIVDSLSLEQKVHLLTGQDFWTTYADESIGLRSMVFSDGPAGVRGELWDERSPSLNFPSGTALSSSWDAGIARRYGHALAAEARRKGVDIVLGPTVNLHRSPLGGRSFEAFSEDPLLTAQMAAAYVEGMQERGVAACLKHYIANEYETDRFTADSVVGEQALRELYLTAFEAAVTDAHAWSVMSSYNAINGTTATESPLLRTPLKDEWAFDGVVVSDWTGVRSLESAASGQDMAMPGPVSPWGDALVDAVRNGDIDEAVIDDKVRRILLLAARVGALEGYDTVPLPEGEDGVVFARIAAAAGSVLLANDGTLPLAAETLKCVAVIGHNASQPRTQGGGSAAVLTEHVSSPLQALREALPSAEIISAIGAVVQVGIAAIPLEEIENPALGTRGALVRFLDGQGNELFHEDRRATTLFYFGGDAPVATAETIEVTFRWTPTLTADVLLGFSAVGFGRIFVDGELQREGTGVTDGMDLGAALSAPPAVSTPVHIAEGRPIDVRIEFDLTSRFTLPGLEGIFGINIGIEADDSRPEELLREAVAAAERAQVAVVVVGTNSQIESEGFDRTDLRLPGRQDDLVRAVIATGTPTIVIVNAGASVLLPWRDEAAAILLTYFGGQEMAGALTDMLLGVVEPGGRLPTTWPATDDTTHVPSPTPVDGKVNFVEGIHIGYRSWLAAGDEPAFAFGHGLGYTRWALSDLEVEASPERGVYVTVANTGPREGKQIIQVYLSRTSSAYERPVRWLAGFASVHLAPAATETVHVALPDRVLQTWSDGSWILESGYYDVHVGTSSTQLPLSAPLLVR